MSIHAMNTVWRESKASGAMLLLQLAIADHARDNGWAWPGVESLAKKTRMDARSVTRLIQKLEDMGELMVDRNAGPRGTNMYLLLLISKGRITQPDDETGGDKLSPLTSCHPDNASLNCHPNHKEPSVEREREDSGCVEWPSMEDVLKVAINYQGNMAKGIPAIMPKAWAEYHWHHRTHEKREWSPKWAAAMVSLFELRWSAGDASARGEKAFQGGSSRFSKKTSAPDGRRERGEILQELAQAKKTGAPVEQLKRELAAA